jgi:GTP-binding protein
MTLEHAMEWIEDDELIEVTPESIRIRKKYLDPVMRRRVQRDKKNATK